MINASLFDDSSILVIDDQSTSRTILTQVVRSINPKIKVIEKSNPIEALVWVNVQAVDLVLVDYVMPEMDGVTFVQQLRALPAYATVPIIMITMSKDAGTRYAALDSGVTDFINKPVDMYECKARITNLLTMHQQHMAILDKSYLLEGLVKIATAEIKTREKETLLRLARAGEYKDADTALHLKRMSQVSRMLAEAIGFNEEDAEVIELSAPLHDIGKVGIPDSILLKKGKLDEDELKIMRTHPLIGYGILQDSPSIYLQKGGEIALAHHEKYDGSGYPRGVKGEEIPLVARVVAVADVFDALTSERPYKAAWSIDQALDYIRDESGKHFDPELVFAMLAMRSKLENYMNQTAKKVQENT